MIDLYSLSTTSRKSGRATVLGEPGASAATIRQCSARKAAKTSDVMATRVDPGVVASLLSALVTQIEGRNLGSIVPAVANLVNDRLGLNATSDFQDAISSMLYAAITDAGRVVTAPAVDREPHQRSLSAGAIGVSPGTVIRRSTPRTVRRFDEMSAMFSDGVSLAAVLDGANDGFPPGFSEAMTGFFTVVRNGFMTGDVVAVAVAAQDLGAMLVALDQAVNGEPARRSVRRRVMRRVGKSGHHYVLDGYEPVLKSQAKITHIRVGDEDVPTDQVTFSGGKPIRRRSRSLA